MLCVCVCVCVCVRACVRACVFAWPCGRVCADTNYLVRCGVAAIVSSPSLPPPRKSGHSKATSRCGDGALRLTAVTCMTGRRASSVVVTSASTSLRVLRATSNSTPPCSTRPWTLMPALLTTAGSKEGCMRAVGVRHTLESSKGTTCRRELATWRLRCTRAAVRNASGACSTGR